MSQTTKELTELMEKLPEEVQRHIFRLAQAEAAKLVSSTAGNQTFLEAASRLGAVGILKDGPVDLSSNPKHLEGFGQ